MKGLSLGKSIYIWAFTFLVIFFCFVLIAQSQISNSAQNIRIFNDREMMLNKKIFEVSDIQKGLLYDLDKLDLLQSQLAREEITKDQFMNRSEEIISFIEEEIDRSYDKYYVMKEIAGRYENSKDIIMLSVDLYITDFKTFESSFNDLKIELRKMNDAQFILSLYSASIDLAKRNLNFVINSYHKEFDAIVENSKQFMIEGHKNIFSSVIVVMFAFCILLFAFLFKIRQTLISPLYKMTSLVQSITDYGKGDIDISNFEGEVKDLASALVAMKDKVLKFEEKIISQKRSAMQVKEEQERLLQDLSHFFKGHIDIVNTVLHDIGMSQHLDDKESNLIHLAEKETLTIKEVVQKVEHLYPSSRSSKAFFEKTKIDYDSIIKELVDLSLSESENIDKKIELDISNQLEKLIYVNEEVFRNTISQLLKISINNSESEQFKISVEKLENEMKDFIYITLKDQNHHVGNGHILNSNILNTELGEELEVLKKEVDIIEGTVFVEKLNNCQQISLLIPTTFIPTKEQVGLDDNASA